jgi:hypothetical protein
MEFGEKFLRFPDLFPTRRSGESWGSEALVIDFVGGPYLFTGLDPRQVEATRERFGELCHEGSSEDKPEVSTRLFRMGRDEFVPFDLQGWNYTFDRDYGEHSVRIAGLQFLGRVDWDPDLVGALYTSEVESSSFQCLFENYFRVLVSYRLLALGGVLLHSAGIVSFHRAHLFLGPSGAGKTTISRLGLATGRTVLSDDMNALCPDDEGQARVEKLPFAGDLGRTPSPRSSYPLASLNRLRQGEDAVRPLARAEAVATLISCAPFVNGDSWRLDQLVENLKSLLSSFPAQELTFSMAGSFWSLLENSPPFNSE